MAFELTGARIGSRCVSRVSGLKLAATEQGKINNHLIDEARIREIDDGFIIKERALIVAHLTKSIAAMQK